MDAVVCLEKPGEGDLVFHHNLSEIFGGGSSDAVFSFLLAALGVWAADKLHLRAGAPDAWSRVFTLHLPVAPVWESLAPRLAELSNFLTGDTWTLTLRKKTIDLPARRSWPHQWTPQAVVMFSGGLDSLAGAIDLLEAGDRLLLVSHYDYGQLAAVQQTLAGELSRHYGPDRFHHLMVRVQLEGPELTLRSRSLLYLALGLAAAAAFRPDVPLLIPENGWISLNPPLTPNRLGSYSTRTTHPYFLQRLTGLWRESGITNPLVNPYQRLAKGQALAQCANRPLLERLYPLTISCARPVASRWQRLGAGACGYCYPCLIRRVALHRLGWDRGGDYLLDVLAAPEALRHRTRGRDLRALLLALRTWEDAPGEVAARLYWGEPEQDLSWYASAQILLASGFREIAQFFRDRGPVWIKNFLGWS
jgi:7-cyano-7-deazaguanine synthase in queuosine biosynthesis